MEAVLITKRRKGNYARIKIRNHTFTYKSAIKYLAVMSNAKLNFKQHVKYSCEKAFTESMTLARKMPYLERRRHTCTLPVARMVSSILLYAIPI